MNNFFLNLTSKKTVKPKHIARRIGRLMDSHKTESVSKTYVPCRFKVFLAREDWERMEDTFQSMTADLIDFVIRHATKHDYEMLTEPEIRYELKSALETGDYEVEPLFDNQSNDSTVDQVNTMVFDKEDLKELKKTGSMFKTTPEVFLEVLEGNDVGMKFDLLGMKITLGRKEDNQVMINDPNVSRYHAIIINDKEWRIEDLKSTNGLFINGKLVKKSPLAAGDQIKMGSTLLKFRIE